MACPPSRDSIENEAECEDTVIYIHPDLPPAKWPKDAVIYIPPDLLPLGWRECCIYRVPKKLRKVNEEAYTPKLVSIGPFHYRQKELRDMEMHKLRYFMDFCKRTSKSQKSLLKIIEDDEEKIRHHYSEDFRHISSIDFVKMILLDAIFIIELFLKKKEEECDYILSKPWLQNGILLDLILLENQLPFFVLEELHELTLNEYSSSDNHHEEGKPIEHKEGLEKEDTPFVKLSRNYFKRYEYHDQQQPLNVKEVKHFTDLLRYLFGPSKERMEELRSEEPPKRHMEKWSSAERGLDTRFCATKLDDAGLKFEAAKDHCRLLDISVPNCVRRFSCFHAFPRLLCLIACLPCIICLICFPCLLRIQRMLKVPKLVINDDTETIFRNLMALEQCHYPHETYICNYVGLLDRLVDTDKDVDLLVQKKVIDNQLGSNTDVASLINKLCVHIVETPSPYFDKIVQKLNDHYGYPFNHTMATLKREYFPNIFRGTATVVGLIVLGFTLWNILRPFVV